MCLVGTNLNQFKMLLLKTVQRNLKVLQNLERVASGPPRPSLLSVSLSLSFGINLISAVIS